MCLKYYNIFIQSSVPLIHAMKWCYILPTNPNQDLYYMYIHCLILSFNHPNIIYQLVVCWYWFTKHGTNWKVPSGWTFTSLPFTVCYWQGIKGWIWQQEKKIPRHWIFLRKKSSVITRWCILGLEFLGIGRCIHVKCPWDLRRQSNLSLICLIYLKSFCLWLFDNTSLWF